MIPVTTAEWLSYMIPPTGTPIFLQEDSRDAHSPLSLHAPDLGVYRGAPAIPMSARVGGESTPSLRDSPLNVRPGHSLIQHGPNTYCVPGTVEAEKVNGDLAPAFGTPGSGAGGLQTVP